MADDKEIYRYELEEAYKKGFLVKPTDLPVPAEAIHYSNLGLKEKKEKNLGRIYTEEKEPVFRSQVKAYRDLHQKNAGFCPGMLFAADIAHAQEIYDEITGSKDNKIRCKLMV